MLGDSKKIHKGAINILTLLQLLTIQTVAL